VETELIHAFLRGELTGSGREQFESVYCADAPRARRLASEREWFESAKLARAAGQRAPAGEHAHFPGVFFQRDRPLKFAALFALIALGLGGWGLSRRLTALEAALRDVRTDSSRPSAAPPATVSFLLAPGQSRCRQ
jgi:hypothetical protein